MAGWAFWKTNEVWPKNAWGFVAGAASVLSVAHVALKVSDRVDWSDTKGHFVRLRTELETFVYRMKVNPAFDLDEFVARFDGLRTRFGEGIDRKKVDFLAYGIKGLAEPEARKRRDVLDASTDRLIIGIEAGNSHDIRPVANGSRSNGIGVAGR